MKQNKLNVSLAPGIEGERQKASLEWLAAKLRFRSVSALVANVATAADVSPVDFAAAMERAFSIAAGIEE